MRLSRRSPIKWLTLRKLSTTNYWLRRKKRATKWTKVRESAFNIFTLEHSLFSVIPTEDQPTLPTEIRHHQKQLTATENMNKTTTEAATDDKPKGLVTETQLKTSETTSTEFPTLATKGSGKKETAPLFSSFVLLQERSLRMLLALKCLLLLLLPSL